MTVKDIPYLFMFDYQHIKALMIFDQCQSEVFEGQITAIQDNRSYL